MRVPAVRSCALETRAYLRAARASRDLDEYDWLTAGCLYFHRPKNTSHGRSRTAVNLVTSMDDFSFQSRIPLYNLLIAFIFRKSRGSASLMTIIKTKKKEESKKRKKRIPLKIKERRTQDQDGCARYSERDSLFLEGTFLKQRV